MGPESPKKMEKRGRRLEDLEEEFEKAREACKEASKQAEKCLVCSEELKNWLLLTWNKQVLTLDEWNQARWKMREETWINIGGDRESVQWKAISSSWRDYMDYSKKCERIQNNI